MTAFHYHPPRRQLCEYIYHIEVSPTSSSSFLLSPSSCLTQSCILNTRNSLTSFTLYITLMLSSDSFCASPRYGSFLSATPNHLKLPRTCSSRSHIFTPVDVIFPEQTLRTPFPSLPFYEATDILSICPKPASATAGRYVQRHHQITCFISSDLTTSTSYHSSISSISPLQVAVVSSRIKSIILSSHRHFSYLLYIFPTFSQSLAISHQLAVSTS